MHDLREQRKHLLVLQGWLAGAAVLNIVNPGLDPTFRAVLAGALLLLALSVLADWALPNRPLTPAWIGLFVVMAHGLLFLMVGLAIVLFLLGAVGVIES